MFLPFLNAQPTSFGLRAGGRWLNWAKSTRALPVWETPFVAADHLQSCTADHDFASWQEAIIDDHTIYAADSVGLFTDGNPVGVVPIPPLVQIAGEAPHSAIADPGFESVQVGAGQFKYNPTGSPWTFAGTSGITANKSSFTSASSPSPEGNQVAFLQSNGAISQTVSDWTPGTYILTFAATQRVISQTSRQDFTVLVDGAIVGAFLPASGVYQRYATSPFAIATGSHTITFRGLNTSGGDNTAFVDSIVQAMVVATSPPVSS